MRGIPRGVAWPLVFAVCVIAAGARSVLLGKDANWDLRNYHWYNAWALLNGRLGIDIAPAQLQTYHNPLGDLPFYALVQGLSDPREVAFCMGLPVAVAAFFLLRILVLLHPFDRSRANGVLWIVASAAIGLSGAAGTATWGSTMNEWPSAALTLAALWLAVRGAVQGEGRRPRAFAAAGFLVGCAVGLKLTYGVYALGFIASSLAFGSLRDRAQRSLVAGCFALAGFLACYAWWGWTLWTEFGNPFFPYFNAIFHSPWWEPVNFFDANFGPRDWRQAIFFPVYFSHRSLLVGEVAFRDYRLAVLMFAAIAAWAISRFRNLRENPNAPAPPEEPVARAWRVLALFTFVSYLAWLDLFGIYRYLVPLELLSGTLIVGCVLYVLVRGRRRMVAVLVLAALLVGTTHPGSWGRIPFGGSYFEISAPALPPKALVIVGFRHPMAYAIPFFVAPDARFVSPANNLIMPGQRNRLARGADEAIRAHEGPMFLLEYKERDMHDERTLAYFGLVPADTDCVPVPSTFDANYMRLCPLKPGKSFRRRIARASVPRAAPRRARRSRAIRARA